MLPLKASGHTYNLEIDFQPVMWDQVEVNLGEKCINFVAFDATPEVTNTGIEQFLESSELHLHR